MNNFFLPNLKSIKIKDFSLYPNGLSFEYKFVEGINLIIGGNGVGKTTFLNLIKYAIIGLYKKGTDVRRREEKRIEKRTNLPYTFFRNRMDSTYANNEQATVEITFKINQTEFVVTRALYNPTLKKVIIRENNGEYELNGEIITQIKFDDQLRYKPDSLNNTLQQLYEDKVGEASNLIYFDSLIFLVNEVLFFGESRKTIVWERDTREESSVQSKLSSKYFNDPELDNKRQETELNAKYHDSLSRHYSEDVRAINSAIRKITDTDNNNKDFKFMMQQVEEAKNRVQQLRQRIDDNERIRKRSEIALNESYTSQNNLSQSIDDCEKRKLMEEESIFREKWQKLNPKYSDLLKYIKAETDCPLCNQHMPEATHQHIISHEANCMLCGNEISTSSSNNPIIKEINLELEKLLNQRTSVEKDIIQIEQTIKRLDEEFNKFRMESNNAQVKQRRLEYALQQQQTDKDDKTDIEFTVMKARIDELNEKRQEHATLSRDFRKEIEVIDSKIDEKRLEVRGELSDAFSQYASQFLGVPCELVYENFGEGLNKRYLPMINGIVRKDEEELSESQRFFIDQSFRMSLLNYFYTSPTFFMCETPDSSLDISYERNAAKIFLKYVEKPNALIITSNLNNSEFLDYIIEYADNIDFINLLTIGRKSGIQASSEQLINASKKIEAHIYAKRS